MKIIFLILFALLVSTTSFSKPELSPSVGDYISKEIFDMEMSPEVFFAKKIEVTTTEDRESDDGYCSLTEAVETANTGAEYGNCTITGTGSRYAIHLQEGTYNLSSNLEIMNSVYIVGKGSDKTIIQLNGYYSISVNIGASDGIETLSITLSSLAIAESEKYAIFLQNSSSGTTINFLLKYVLLNKNGSDNGFDGSGLHVSAVDGTTNVSIRSSVISDNLSYYRYGDSTHGSGVGTGAYFSSNDGATLNVDIYGSEFLNNYGFKGAGIGSINSGGIATFTIQNTRVSGNKQKLSSDKNEYGDGGGMYFQVYGGGSSKVNIKNSDLSNNLGNRGGGIFAESTDNTGSVKINIKNSTLSSNQAYERGGAIYLAERVELAIENSTIAGNKIEIEGGNGGGIYTLEESKFSMKNTILSDNMVDQEANDCYYKGDFSSYGYNLVETNCDLNLTGTDDQQGVDPQLENLADNGGSTYTQALSATSPARDAGSCTDSEGSLIEKDQRGEKRDDTKCDIGAYEYQEGEEAGGSTSSSSSGTDTEGGTEATGEGASGTTTTGSESGEGEPTSGTSGSSAGSGESGAGGSATGDGSENSEEPAASCSFHEV